MISAARSQNRLRSAIRTLALAFLAGCGGGGGSTSDTSGQTAAGPVPSLPALVPAYYVSPLGLDTNPGTSGRPFKTWERARDAVRLEKTYQAVYLRDGVYRQSATLELDQRDAGTSFLAYPDETPVISGAADLTVVEPVTDNAIRNRLQPAVRDRVVKIDLLKNGIASPYKISLGGSGSKRDFITYPFRQLYFEGAAMPISRWPKSGYDSLLSASSVTNPDGSVASEVLGFSGTRPRAWAQESNLLLHGFFQYLFADSYEEIASIDTQSNAFVVTPPQSLYSYVAGAPYYALNVLAEISDPGEWAYDAATESIYFLPPDSRTNGLIQVSLLEAPMVHITNGTGVSMINIAFEKSAGDGIVIDRGANIRLAGCTIRDIAGNAVTLNDGVNNIVEACDLYNLGRGGVKVAAGDRATLTPSGHDIRNNHIYNNGHVDATYTQGVLIDGVGTRVANNYFHDMPSSAMRINGNNHLIEYNEVHRVMLASADQGALDMWGDPTYRGNILRYNYFHHLGDYASYSVADQKINVGWGGIRLDDMISGTQLYGNIFHKIANWSMGAIHVHGGKENTITNNLFSQCKIAVTFGHWPTDLWLKTAQPMYNWFLLHKDLYLARYPLLADFNGSLNTSLVAMNVAINVDNFMHGSASTDTFTNNLTDVQGNGFKDPANGDFTMLSLPDNLKAIGYVPIDFPKIGLYVDASRKQLPLELIVSSRR